MRPLGEPSNEDVWFYAVEVFVDGVKGLPLNDQSFIHLEDTDLDNPLACLQIEPPTEPDKDFGLSILATLDSNSKTIWNGEFNFQDRVVAVVKWDNNTGQATLWVNPLLSKDPEVDNESVTNSDPLHSMATIDNLVLRQSIGAKNTGTIITINRLVTGLNFGVLVPIAFDFLIQLGDINRDCMVNLLDVAPFVELLLNGQYDPVADFNADGVVDLLDIELFVQALTS